MYMESISCGRQLSSASKINLYFYIHPSHEKKTQKETTFIIDCLIHVQSVLPVCDKPYHTNKRKVQNEEEILVLQKCALYDMLDLLS